MAGIKKRASGKTNWPKKNQARRAQRLAAKIVRKQRRAKQKLERRVAAVVKEIRALALLVGKPVYC